MDLGSKTFHVEDTAQHSTCLSDHLWDVVVGSWISGELIWHQVLEHSCQSLNWEEIVFDWEVTHLILLVKNLSLFILLKGSAGFAFGFSHSVWILCSSFDTYK
ncbi:hypothetical protein Dimus_002590 [Dionaea muscipula]